MDDMAWWMAEQMSRQFRVGDVGGRGSELVASLCCPANCITEPHVGAVNRRKRLRK